MVNDSVREELETKIVAPFSRSDSGPIKRPPTMSVEPARADVPSAIAAEAPASAVHVKKEIPRPSPPLKRETNPLNGPKTSPTLVGFQSKNAAIPDWRLQLQNSVRQRRGGPVQHTDAVSDGSQARLVTQGANALKAEIVEEAKPEPVREPANPKVANALRRIDQSRKTFLPDTDRRTPKQAAPAQATRNYPFNVVAKTRAIPQRTPDGKPLISEPPKPKLVPTFKIEKKKFDTNKLPAICEEPVAEAVADSPVAAETIAVPVIQAKPDISIQVTKPEPDVQPLSDNDEIEDLAPISVRFNAALFDLIIGAFGSFALVSPIVLMGGDWFSFAGFAAFAGVWATTMFIYMTLAIGMYGKTFGMRMFGLELVDAEENDYPTFHQAAVHSAVFLLSLPFLGAGFLPIIFNQEQRAAHDLAAGTIIVTEF